MIEVGYCVLHVQLIVSVRDIKVVSNNTLTQARVPLYLSPVVSDFVSELFYSTLLLSFIPLSCLISPTIYFCLWSALLSPSLRRAFSLLLLLPHSSFFWGLLISLLHLMDSPIVQRGNTNRHKQTLSCTHVCRWYMILHGNTFF